MSTKAIYTVIDKSGSIDFITDIAGGFSYPFEIFTSARISATNVNKDSIMEGTQPHEMLPLMRANYRFPKELQGKKIFSALADEQADKMKRDFAENDDIPYHITLDFQKNDIGFEFNRNIHEEGLCDLQVSAFDERFNDIGYDSFMRLRSPNEVNECYRCVIAELCQSKTIKNLPLVVIEFDSPKGVIDINLPAGESEINSLRSLIENEDLDLFYVKVKTVNHENLTCLKELWQPKFTVLNKLTQALENNLGAEINPHETFAAAMEGYDITDAEQALTVAENIDAFECIHVSNDEEYGHYVLYESERDDVAKYFSEYVEDYIDYDMFGYDRAEDDGVVRTKYGYVLRDDSMISLRMQAKMQEQSM